MLSSTDVSISLASSDWLLELSILGESLFFWPNDQSKSDQSIEESVAKSEIGADDWP